MSVMVSTTPKYDDRCFTQWDQLEEELPQCREGTKDRFLAARKEALSIASQLQADKVPQTLWMQKMAAQTIKLASIIQEGIKAQAFFEQQQAIVRGKEGLFSRCTQEGAFEAVKSASQAVFAGVVGGVVGGKIVPAPGMGTPVGVAVGLATHLIVGLCRKQEE